MADLIIAGTTYSGSPTNTANPQRPDVGGFKRRRIKVGRLVIGRDGTQNWMHRGFKWEWEISWKSANQTTETAVLAVRNQVATFAFTDYDGTAYTVVNVGEDAYEEALRTNKANAYLFDLTLILRQI